MFYKINDSSQAITCVVIKSNVIIFNFCIRQIITISKCVINDTRNYSLPGLQFEHKYKTHTKHKLVTDGMRIAMTTSPRPVPFMVNC